ncbi:MAG: CRISPR-associated endonuclease Cas1 [Lentimicrobiaceae bacterium]|nr:CRISPR-associated endonuclease Cas1 [Lentimicrobiaceae bacterium]
MDLVLNTFGTSLQVENQLFLVVHADGKQWIDPEKLKSISISKGARLSSDAALLAIEHEIEVLFIDAAGKPAGRLWSVKYGSISTIRRGQLAFTQSTASINWIKDLIGEKLDNQMALLLSITSDDIAVKNLVARNIERIQNIRDKVADSKAERLPDLLPSLRGWEGSASKYYFNALSACLPESLRFIQRSQNPGMDVFNMLLNYAYGMLYGKVEGALIKAGIDPYIGVMHRDEYNRPVLVYDVIERFRVWADYVVYGLTAQQVFIPGCYTVREDGSYWLENSGKRILIQSFNDYLNEVIKIKGVERSRQVHIDLYAQSLARMFEIS